MVDLCDDLTADARLIGAVNVIHRTQDGRLLGTMLDGEGFVAGLRAEGIEPQGLSAYVAGAGGAASAICFALVRAGVKRLTIANRTTDKVVQLIDRIKTMSPSVELLIGSPDPSGNDLVVNATSLGLRSDDALPLNALQLQPNQVVAEIIMQPVETPLLKAAAARGCRIHFGAPMLASQVPLMANFMRYGRIEGAHHAA
jgi:shikimate dehydrogenase